MSELADKFIAARFEKKADPSSPGPKALLDQLSGAPARKYELEQVQQSEMLQKVRRAIERSVSKEEELRNHIGEAGRYAQQAAIAPPAPTMTESVLEAFPTLAATTGIGAGLGYMSTPQRLGQALSGLDLEKVRATFADKMGIPVKRLPKNVVDLAHAVYGSHKFNPMRLLGKLPWIRERFGHMAQDVAPDILEAARKPGMGQLRKTYMSSAALGKNPPKVRSPWLGAGLGFAAGMAPSVISHWLKSWSAKKYGGMKALSAHEAARKYSQRAEALRRWREAQMAQLESGAAPESIPFAEFQQQIPNIRFGPTAP